MNATACAAAVVTMGLGLAGCDAPAVVPDGGAPTDSGEGLDAGRRRVLGDESCPDLACLACAAGAGCAPEGPFFPGTCCAEGDALVHVGTGDGAEVVDIEIDSDNAYLCGGFGVRISRITEPARPTRLAAAAERCQRIGLGEPLAEGGRILYLAHHGDTWVPTPFLRTYHLRADGDMDLRDEIQDADVSFEGLFYRDGMLLVAAHAGGLRVYRTDADGVPSLQTVLGGFDNAWKVDVLGDFAYVADGQGGLRVVEIADPSSPRIVQSVATSGLAHDVEAEGDRVYVALGTAGVDVFDATSASNLVPLGNIPSTGSVQGVSAEGDLLALASWSHVELRDARTFRLLGTERVKGRFEQDFGIALRGSHLYVGEWEGLHVVEYREGLVAPDILLGADILTLPDAPSARAVIVSNRGLLDLEVSRIAVDDSAFSVDRQTLLVAPGTADVFELGFQPPAAAARATLLLETDDPDPGQTDLAIPIEIADGGRIGVGDPLPEVFGFLDPAGLDGLRGHVIVIAYFALF